MSSKKADEKPRKEKKAKGPMVFIAGITILSVICIPYMYYAIQINSFGLANKPATYVWPEYSMAWKTAVGFVMTAVLNKFVMLTCYSTALKFAKV